MMRRELLMGCGHNRDKRIELIDHPGTWRNLVTCDMYAECKPDVVCDLEKPLPFAASSFDEVHAYEVLEHLGGFGDYRSFFAQFSEIHRILKPGGHLMATCPPWNKEAAFADPGHRRVITPVSLSYLSQAQYAKQIDQDKGWMTDYRWLYKADFQLLAYDVNKVGIFWFIIQAVK